MKRVQNAQRDTFAWDAFNRMTRANTRHGVATFAYDPLGRRIAKHSQAMEGTDLRGQTQTTYGWDGDTMALENGVHPGPWGARPGEIKLTDKKSFVKIDRDKLLSVLVDIECILISLHKIGSFYGERLPEKYSEYCEETTSFIDNNKTTQKIARMRTILSEEFGIISVDGLSDIERALEGMKYWSPKKES